MSTNDVSRLAFAATQRNRGPILEVLERLLVSETRTSTPQLLEIASGSGEHATYFAQQLPHLRVQPSDPEPAHRASIDAWAAHLGLQDRVLPALDLDVLADVGSWPQDVWHQTDLVFCANMIHIAPWRACERLLFHVHALKKAPSLVLYGPFIQKDVVTAESNVAFDASLKARNPDWGIRHLDDVARHASYEGFALTQVIPMPANNLMVVFGRISSEF